MRLSGDGCTAVASLPLAGSGHTVLAQNWDWHPTRSDACVLLRILPDEGPSMLAFAEAGALARCGLNEMGLGVVGNALECQAPTSPEGVPIALIRRQILGASTLSDAVDVVALSPRGTATNHLIASVDEGAVSCETTPDAVYTVSPEDGLLVHSNHFISPEAEHEVMDTGIASHPDTLDRAPRIRKILGGKARAANAAEVEEALRDHEGYPYSVCRHEPNVSLDTWTTVASIVMDLDDRRLSLAPGPPCEAEFRTHFLSI
ncbi:MAG: C45 family peptidase, partial [Verrucomicrobiales bacterium]